MANYGGRKWTLGGAKSRNKLELNLQGFGELLAKLDGLDGNMKEAVTDAFQQAAETVGEDTASAMATGNLPAGGKYSHGDTVKAVVQNPEVIWSGTVVEAGVGFDKTQPGAGGFLITGTPRMRPVKQLEDIFVSKRYFKKLSDDMMDVVQDYIDKVV